MSYKTFFLLSPLLWLRKLILYVLGLFIVLGVLVYFIANSPWLIQKTADTFAPDYNITYSRIHGNVLTGIEIEDLAYNSQPLAKHLHLKWNPNGLVKKHIIVNDLVLDKVNVDTIKKLVETFSSEDNTSSEPFAFSVSVAKVEVDIDPFTEQNVSIQKIILHAEDIYYDSKTLDIGDVGLVVDTNITKLLLKASMQKGIVNVSQAEISALDTLALEQMLLRQKSTNSTASAEESNDTVSSPLMPTRVNIQVFAADILPRNFEPLEVDALSLKLSDASLDLETLALDKGHLTLLAQTNFADAKHEGDITKNHLIGDLAIKAKEGLFRKYDLPLRQGSLGKIDIHLDATQARIIAKLDTKMMQVLKVKKDAFNLDIDALKSTVTYTPDDGILKAESNAVVTTPYAKDIKVSNLFVMDKNISYKGDIFVKQLLGVNPKFVKPVNDLRIAYHGNDKSIDTKILSNMLEGTFVSKDFKHAMLHIESKKAILLRDYMTLPPELNASKANIVIELPLDFDSNASYMANMKIASNIVNIDANMSYKKRMHLRALIDIPKKSLLRPYRKDLNWDKLIPLNVEGTLFESDTKVHVDAGMIHVNADYNLDSTEVNGEIHLGGLKVNIGGMAKKRLNIHSTLSHISSLLKDISEIYTLENIPKVDGSANIDVNIIALKKVDMSLTSPLIRYHTSRKKSMDIHNINVGIVYKEGNLTLKHYRLTYGKEKIFATKPSHISLDDNTLIISPLWINDQLKTQGSYDFKTKKGKVFSKAEKLHISHDIIDLDSNINLTTVLDGNKTDIQGKIVILDGDIHYNISQKHFASDSDIVIVQDMKKETNSTFMNHLSMAIQITTQNPIVYKKHGINIKAKADLSVHKAEHGTLLLLGSVSLLSGGSYIFQNKKFVLDKSYIYFTGNPNKPLLDIGVKYHAVNHVISIAITGSADMPNIRFSSKPSLTKEQILSLILFDSETGAGTNSGNDMMKMMGGAMAKSALNDMGIKLDHLVLGAGNSIEVGKKLTSKITIIYVNDAVSSVKLKYQHGKHTESIVGASAVSQSYDIIYKTDF